MRVCIKNPRGAAADNEGAKRNLIVFAEDGKRRLSPAKRDIREEMVFCF